MRIFRRGIDTTHFKPSKSAKLALQKQLGLPDGVYLLYTGRISRDKNLSLLLEAFHLATAQHPKLTLLLAGEGPHRKDLEKIAGKQVRFLGRVERNVLPDYYAAATCSCFPASPTPSHERAGGAGVRSAALVSNVGGPQELVVDGETGWIVRENTAQA
jgi:glycosyltransferase involved in cell wall biosynthesis